MTKVTIADEREEYQGPARKYGEEEALCICNEFVELVKTFCDKYQAAFIGELLFTKDDETNGMLFVMQGAVPERGEVDRALAMMLTETRRFYSEHHDAQ